VIYTQNLEVQKTVESPKEVYKRLETRQRNGEGVTDLLNERQRDCLESFRTLPDGAAEALEDAASASR